MEREVGFEAEAAVADKLEVEAEFRWKLYAEAGKGG